MTAMSTRQRGITLFISMVLLVLITLVAITTFNVGKASMQIVGNLQQGNQTTSAATEAIETAISTTRLVNNPTAIVPGCNGAPNTVCVDLNADGTSDVNVALKGKGATGNPNCIKAQVVKNATLDLSSSEDLACTIARQSFGVQGASAGDSLCTDAIYEIVAVASDSTTQSNVTVTEGVALRVPTETVANNCP